MSSNFPAQIEKQLKCWLGQIDYSQPMPKFHTFYQSKP